MARLSKEYTVREKKEGRCFECIYYPDSEEGIYADNFLGRLQYYWPKFYYILHDKDVYLEKDFDLYVMNHGSEPEWKPGDLKKPHYHVIGYDDSPVVLGRAASRFGCPSNLVQKVSKFKESVQYLIHANNPEKYQYQTEQIITNDPDLEKLLRRPVDAEKKADLLVNAIFDSDIYTMESLCRFALKEHLWDELRRGQHIYSQLLREKNLVRKEEHFDIMHQGFKELHEE